MSGAGRLSSGVLAVAVAGFCCAGWLTTAACAQIHKVAAPEAVTRAVGIYEWTGDLSKPTAARLVPVSLFIDGQFQDAGTYYARPIPLALLTGNVYSLEKAGRPQGNVTVDYARHLQTATNAGTDDSTDLGWFGYGTFALPPPAKKAVALRAAKTNSEIVSSKDADRPTFAKRQPADKKDDASPSTTSPTPPSPKNSTSTPPAAPEDPDRPHLSRPAATSTPASIPGSAPTPDTASTGDAPDTKAPVTTKTDSSRPDAADPDRPTLRHRDPKQAEADRKARNESGVTAIGSLNNDPDRPTMKRGRTPEQQAAAQLTGLPATLHQSIAVSDAVNREDHPFAREWTTPTERAETLSKLQSLAQRSLAEYVRTNDAANPAPAGKPLPARKTQARRPVAVKPLIAFNAPLSSEALTPYTLSYGGLPTFVYTAISPAAQPGSPERYVTLVAQQVPTGEMQVAFSSVTDAGHLDRTPWFRFIDVVDPNGAHRANLLFELRSRSSRQFALYSILSATAEQTFLTHPSD